MLSISFSHLFEYLTLVCEKETFPHDILVYDSMPCKPDEIIVTSYISYHTNPRRIFVNKHLGFDLNYASCYEFHDSQRLDIKILDHHIIHITSSHDIEDDVKFSLICDDGYINILEDPMFIRAKKISKMNDSFGY